MQLILFGSLIFIILFIIRLYNYYKPAIDFVISDIGIKILLWYNKYENSFVRRTYIKLLGND